LESGEAADGNILADLGDCRFEDFSDRQIGVSNKGLFQKAGFGVKSFQFAFDDFIDYLFGLA
jgi:hypothetical protein